MLNLGLIPAHAGKTLHGKLTALTPSAHPRSRGENHPGVCLSGCAIGSSPLTRGKRHRAREDCLGRRLIPAHAGKTTAVASEETANGAHPRSRGENRLSEPRDARTHGSSPLTRGKPERVEKRCFGARLIPAHAGKTCSTVQSVLIPEAHPRSRGENPHVVVENGR